MDFLRKHRFLITLLLALTYLLYATPKYIVSNSYLNPLKKVVNISKLEIKAIKCFTITITKPAFHQINVKDNVFDIKEVHWSANKIYAIAINNFSGSYFATFQKINILCLLRV